MNNNSETNKILQETYQDYGFPSLGKLSLILKQNGHIIPRKKIKNFLEKILLILKIYYIKNYINIIFLLKAQILIF